MEWQTRYITSRPTQKGNFAVLSCKSAEESLLSKYTEYPIQAYLKFVRLRPSFEASISASPTTKGGTGYMNKNINYRYIKGL